MGSKSNSQNKKKQSWLQKLLKWLANGAKKAEKDMASCSK